VITHVDPENLIRIMPAEGMRTQQNIRLPSIQGSLFISGVTQMKALMLVFGIEQLALSWYYSTQRTEQWDGPGIY
jgi:hypothetical protein